MKTPKIKDIRADKPRELEGPESVLKSGLPSPLRKIKKKASKRK